MYPIAMVQAAFCFSCTAFNSSRIDMKQCCQHQRAGVIWPTQKLTKVQGENKSVPDHSFTPSVPNVFVRTGFEGGCN